MVWIASVYIWGIAIHAVPALRGIGLGRQYFKFALVPSLTATALALSARPADALIWALVTVALLLTLRQYVLIARVQRSAAVASMGRADPDLYSVLERIRAAPGMSVMALPVHLCDLVAYETRRPVYWGDRKSVV